MGFARGLKLADISHDGNKLNPLTAAEALTALTDDDTRFSGADIAAILSSVGVSPWVWSAVENAFAQLTATVTREVSASYDSGCNLFLANDAAKVGIGHFYVPVEAAYTMYFIGHRANDAGILRVYTNGDEKGNVDMYHASGVYDQVFSLNLGTLTVGNHALTLRVSDKNGSSSDYLCRIQVVTVVKT